MNVLRRFIRVVDAVNYRIGRVVMYGVFAMMAILLWSSISKVALVPSLWTLESAQFAMVAYFFLGGPYSIQMGANVRMDLLYEKWSPRRKAMVDAVTVFCLLAYLVVLMWGAWESTAYALEYGERSRTAWRPYLWPIKLVLCIGIVLMILQALSELAKDLLRIRGETPPGHTPDEDRSGDSAKIGEGNPR
ncbi:TRAP transporter small permease subunit [Jiella sp. LLJ827]|nr:TRAP transporter small permease subunit [Jiella sp. LLJ827]MCQ0986583.1 TRAP transporter small permease subunit [Jiella sp. LLJ827]